MTGNIMILYWMTINITLFRILTLYITTLSITIQIVNLTSLPQNGYLLVPGLREASKNIHAFDWYLQCWSFCQKCAQFCVAIMPPSLVLANWARLASMTQEEIILLVSCHPWWPRQVRVAKLWHKIKDVYAKKLYQWNNTSSCNTKISLQRSALKRLPEHYF